MIQVKELRIGNLICFGKKAFLVHEIQEKCFYVLGEKGIELKNTNCELKPIPLTEEWLLKFGFSSIIDKETNCKSWFYKSFVLLLSSNNDFYFKNLSITKIKYVNQLQNLYFALTGKELEIIS